MREVTSDELKAIQLGILDVVHNYCEKNGIHYWLDSGTLLGSIRHKGYIPWDDDIDLGMLRPDYEKFMKHFNRDNERYQFFSNENDPMFLYPFGKVLDTSTILCEAGSELSINIDIFVFDNVPDDEAEAQKLFKIRDCYRQLHELRISGVDPHCRGIKRCILQVLNVLLKTLPKNFFIKRMVKLCKKYNNASTKRVGDISGFSNMACDRIAVEHRIDGEFEGKYYKIPQGYDAWLRNFYGDYMQLPPEEARVSHHTFKAYVHE